MQAFVLGLLVKAIENPEVRKFLLEGFERVGASLAELLLPKLSALIPLSVGAGLKEFSDKLNIDLPGLSDVVNTIRDGVNAELPDGIDIPFVSEAFRNVTGGFDLSDILFGRK